MARVYEEEKDKHRQLCILKARLVDGGFNVFDTVRLDERKWLKMEVAGQTNVRMMEELLNIKRSKVEPRDSPRDSDWATGSVPCGSSGCGSGSGGDLPTEPLVWAGSTSKQLVVGPALTCALPIGARAAVEVPPQEPPRKPRCGLHGLPPDALWKEEKLLGREIEKTDNDDGVWNDKMILSMCCSMKDTLSYPGEASAIWGLVSDRSFFWDGNPVGKSPGKMWVRGWWRKAQSTRYIEIGCLKRNHRTPKIYPWSVACKGLPCGKEQVIVLLQSLFNA